MILKNRSSTILLHALLYVLILSIGSSCKKEDLGQINLDNLLGSYCGSMMDDNSWYHGSQVSILFAADDTLRIFPDLFNHELYLVACGDIVVLLADTIWYNDESPGGSPNWQMSAISGHGRYYPKEEKLSLKFYHNHNVFDWTLVKQSSTEINGTYGNNWPELRVDSVSLLEQTDSDSIYLSMHLRQYQDAFDSALTNIVLPKFTCATHDYEISVAENFRARFDITYLDNQLFMEVDKVDEDYNGNGYTYYIHQYYTFVGTRTP